MEFTFHDPSSGREVVVKADDEVAARKIAAKRLGIPLDQVKRGPAPPAPPPPPRPNPPGMG